MNDCTNPILLKEVLQGSQRPNHGVALNDSGQSDTAGRMQECLIGALHDGVRTTFSTMCGLQVTPVGSCKTDDRSARYYLSGIVAISGSFKATVIVNVDQEFAFLATEKMLGTRPESIDEDVLDLVGELANMIGGKAKDCLGIEGLTLGLPTVVAGAGHIVAVDSEADVTFLPFHCENGSLTIEVVVA